jgi:hypothetical protein
MSNVVFCIAKYVENVNIRQVIAMLVHRSKFPECTLHYAYNWIRIYIYTSRDQMIENVTRLHFLVQAGRINMVFMNNLER